MENFKELYEKKHTFDDIEKLEEITMNPNKLQQLINKVEDLTDDNYHGEAISVVARTLGYKQYADILDLIVKQHNIFGYLHPSLSAFRNNMKYELFLEVKKNYGLEVAETLLGTEKFLKDYRHSPIK